MAPMHHAGNDQPIDVAENFFERLAFLWCAFVDHEAFGAFVIGVLFTGLFGAFALGRFLLQRSDARRERE